MDYFKDLFGEPNVIRRENWDGKEEPLPTGQWNIISKPGGPQMPFWTGARPIPPLTPEVYKQLGLEPPTIDIDYEVVD